MSAVVKINPNIYEQAFNNDIVQLDGWSFAKGIFRFAYFEKKEGYSGIRLDGLYLDGIFKVLAESGFRKRRSPGEVGSENVLSPFFIYEDGCIIEPVEIGYILDTFRATNISQVEDLKVKYKDREVTFTAESLRELFNKQFNNVFNEKTLRALPLHDKPILEDEKDSAYFFFENGIVKVTSAGRELIPYNTIKDHSIWRSRIIKRNFKEPPESVEAGHWERFIRNVSDTENDIKRGQAFVSAIGYLLHNFNSSAMGQAVICYDEKPTRKGSPEGGTGKGLFVRGLLQMRNGVIIDGKSFADNDKFKWQQISLGTQIVSIDDPNQNFRFEILFSALTDGWSIERKNEQKIYIPPEDSPKIVIPSNIALNSDGSSNKRRQFILEFSDYYSKHIRNGNEMPIVDEHKRVFFSYNPEDGWTTQDWNQFFAFQLNCVQWYLENGLIGYDSKNVVLNQLIQGTSEDFAEWVNDKKFITEQKYDKKELFNEFTDTYYGEDSKFSQAKFTGWLKKWARLNGFDFEQIRESKGNEKVNYFKIAEKTT